MTSQQEADELLAEHQAAKFRLAVTRSDALYNFRTALIRQGVSSVEACELTGEHAKYLDANAADLSVIKSCMERTS